MNWGTYSFLLPLIGKNQESRPFQQQFLFTTTNLSKTFQIARNKTFSFSIWTVRYMLTKTRKKMIRSYRCRGRRSKCFTGIRLKSVLIGKWGRKGFRCWRLIKLSTRTQWRNLKYTRWLRKKETKLSAMFRNRTRTKLAPIEPEVWSRFGKFSNWTMFSNKMTKNCLWKTRKAKCTIKHIWG